MFPTTLELELDLATMLAEEAAKLPPLACEVELASILAARLLHHLMHIAESTATEAGSAFLEDITHVLTMMEDTLRTLVVA